jgi:hypothetical protein
LCCQKNSRRSSTKARTHDPPGRPPDPGARHRTGLRRRRQTGRVAQFGAVMLCPGIGGPHRRLQVGERSNSYGRFQAPNEFRDGL